MPNPSQKTLATSKTPNEGLMNMDFLCTFKIKIEIQIHNMGVSKTSDYIQIKIKMPNPPASSKAQNQDFKDINVLCTFKIEIEGQNLKYGCIQSGTFTILQSPKTGLTNMDVICTFKIKIKALNSEHECIKDN